MAIKQEDLLKLSPGNKDKTIKNKAKDLLKNHPEVINNASGLFHNKNGETVIEDRVPRGDTSIESQIMPRTQYDITNKDLEEIISYAKKIMDPVIKEYDANVANEDALSKAISTYNDGKYANKINANTFKLLLENMNK